jgi:hypothetical protein
MREELIHTASLAGLVVEDLVYEPLDPGEYTAELVGTSAVAYYKRGGIFAFADIAPGAYALRLSGDGFLTQSYGVTLPGPSPLLSISGDNDLIVIVKALNGGSNNITFDPVVIAAGIRAGSPVLADGFSTTLATGLDPGSVTQAKLAGVGTLAPGSVVRMVRDASIRLKYNPYFDFAVPVTQIAGQVTASGSGGRPIVGAQVRLVSIAGSPVTLTSVAGASVATVVAGGQTIVLGTSRDVTTFTNSAGDYRFYFDLDQPSGTTAVEASSPGYVTQAQNVTASPRARTRADFQLAKA